MKNSLRWILIFSACALRFVGLGLSPRAFYIDEAMGAAHSLCYQQTGRDLFGKIGLFSKIDFGGFQSAPFILSGSVWSAVFGSSAICFRSLIALIGCLTVVGIWRLVVNITGDRDKALWAMLFAACLPWAFQFSRISWDAPLATCFLIWALAFVYAKPKTAEPRLKIAATLLIAAIFFALASYTYAPMRLNAGLLLLLLPGVKLRDKALVLGAFALLNLPVLPYYADAEFVSRSKMLALTSSYEGNPYRGFGIGGLLLAFVSQVIRHFSFGFLIAHGDSNLRHSIQTFGMLDVVTYIGCLFAFAFWVFKFRKLASNESALLRLALLGLLAGITPAALTWEGIPHAIRSMGAWPFFAILAAEGWSLAVARLSQLSYAVIAASTLCFGLYLQSYCTVYPQMSAMWFDQPVYDHIIKTHEVPRDYGSVARAYYRMSVLGERCEDIQKEFR